VADKKPTLTLTDVLRARFKSIMDPIGRALNRIGLTPNTMTLTGLAGNAIAATLLAQGNMLAGGLLVLAMGPIDALDGTMARLRGEPTSFGGFVDSVADRYSELLMFGGLLFYYTQHADWLAAAGVYLAAAGSVMVSYTRARGQSLGMDTKVGILTRFERYAVLAPALILNFPLVGIWIVAIFANITALQRIYDVRRQAFEKDKK
jgi:CDP-diacylglycerol--glycerol-3-phosphate 3-phosphatidyltransferase